MPRADEPRVVVRLSFEDKAAIDSAAERAGVATAALVRECAVRYAGRVARDLEGGAVKVRRRSEPKPSRDQFAEATTSRSAMFSQLRTPASIRQWGRP